MVLMIECRVFKLQSLRGDRSRKKALIGCTQIWEPIIMTSTLGVDTQAALAHRIGGGVHEALRRVASE